MPETSESKSTSPSVGVIGAGAWGTALAETLARAGNQVLMWSYEADVCADINRNHINSRYLPGIALNPGITAVADLDHIANAKTLFAVTPAFATTEIATALSPLLGTTHEVVICSKGLRESDGALLSDVWAECAPNLGALAVLSGPSFAIEVAQGKPAALTLAAHDDTTLARIAGLFDTTPEFRLYFSRDLTGVQVGGALKNIIAIVAGLVDAMDMGTNARAAIICRGLAEIMRYAEAVGGQRNTIAGLSGMGDVLLSATSTLSRNYRLGQRLGEGMSLADALAVEGDAIVEGVRTARIVATRAVSHGLDLAIISAIDGILIGDITPQAACELLLSRPQTWELDEHDGSQT